MVAGSSGETARWTVNPSASSRAARTSPLSSRRVPSATPSLTGASPINDGRAQSAALADVKGIGSPHHFLAGGQGGRAGGSSSIATWVAAHFTARTVGGTTIYDLSSSSSK